MEMGEFSEKSTAAGPTVVNIKQMKKCRKCRYYGLFWHKNKNANVDTYRINISVLI